MEEHETGRDSLPSSGRRREPSRGFLLLVIAIAVSLLAGEGLIRIFELRPNRMDLPRYQAWNGREWIEEGTWGGGYIKRPSPIPGIEMGEYVPGASFRVLYASNPRGYFDEDGGVPSRINSLGLRGSEVRAARTPGTFRIIGLGDSFTFGIGVRDSDTYLHLLQENLNEASGGIRYEVLNAGVGGYNTADEIQSLRHRWHLLQPDLVLVGFYLNDAYSERAFFNVGEGDLLLLLREPRGLAKASHLWDLMQFRYRSRRLRKRVQDFYRSSYFSEAATLSDKAGEKGMDWPQARRHLEHAVRLAGEKGFRIVLVLFPHLYNLDGEYPFEEVHRLVKEECRSLGLPLLDLLDTFRGRRAEDLWVHVSDHHPNEIAHRLAADAIARYFTESEERLLQKVGE